MAIESDLIEFESNDNSNKEKESNVETVTKTAIDSTTKNNVQIVEESNFENDKKSKPNIRELLRLSRDSANLKLASIQGTNHVSKLEATNITESEDKVGKLVLMGKESPIWYCPVSTVRLKRKPESSSQKSYSTTKLLSKECNNCTQIQPQMTTSSKTIPSNRSHYDYFVIVRTEFDNFREIEANRLKRRLEKLSDYSVESDKISFSEFEKSIVPWEEDSSSISCYICSKAFSPLFNRKHHCRLCGRLICASSSASGLDEVKCLESIPIKLMNQQVENLKSCSKCFTLLFKKSKHLNYNQTHLNSNLIKINSLYTSINHLRSQILEMIPKFNELLQRFYDSEAEAEKLYLHEDSEKTVKMQWKHDIWALRDTLILISLHMRSTTRELINLVEMEALTTPAWRIFANNFKRSEGQFIQKHMFTLQILNTSTNKKRENYEKMTVTAEDYNNTKYRDIAENSETTTSTMGKIKRFLPSVLTDAFASSVHEISALSLESLALYDMEGNLLTNSNLPVSANSAALEEKEAALIEQKSQLEKFYRNATDDPEQQVALMEAIQEVESELKKLKRYKK